MSSAAAFQVLYAWLEGREEYVSPAEELNIRHLEALREATASRKRGFVLVVERNYRLEYEARRVRLAAELRELWRLPAGQAVDRLIGYDDGSTWRPGVAGLEPGEARVLRRRVLDRWATWEICEELRLAPSSVRVYAHRARRKLREHLGLCNDGASGRVVPERVVCGSCRTGEHMCGGDCDCERPGCLL